MKSIKKLLGIFILCISTLILISSSSFATSTGVVNSDTVRLRKEPSSGETSSIVALMSIGEKVQILSEENGWYKVTYNSKEGYVLKDLIKVESNSTSNTSSNEITTETNTTANTTTNTENTTTEQNVENTNQTIAQNTTIVDESSVTEETSKIVEGYNSKTINKISLKLVPTINSSDICEIVEKTEIKVVEVINKWCYIETILGSGWIRVNTLETNLETENTPVTEPTTPTPEPEQPTTSTTKVGYVNVDSVNLRKDMSTSSEILASLSKNTEVTILSEKDNWYNVKVNNTTGYVASKYISDSKVAETVTSRSAETTRKEVNTNTSNNTTANVEPVSTSNTNTNSNTNSSSTTGSEVVEFAKKYLGYKYVSGGQTPSVGFDCSGFTYYVYKNFGVTLSRASTAQVNNGTAVKKADLQLGDIVVFNNDANTKVGHVGIYVGSNKFIHAANPQKGVIITSLSDSYYSARYITARRII